MMRILKWLLVLVVIGGVAAGVYAYMNHRGESGPGYTLIRAERGDITEKALAVGQIEPRDRYQVKSKISGIVGRCFVEVGDRVEAGDALFEIQADPTPQELLNVDHGLRSAQARYDKAKADLQRGKKLFADGLSSRGELDALAESFDLARVSLEQARDNRELTRKGRVSGGKTRVETTIRARVSGTVLSRSVNAGDPIVPLTSYQPGTEMATIADMSDLIFKGTVDEIDVGKIRVGLPSRIKVGALPEAVVEGRLSRIAPQAQRSEGATLFDVEIELDKGQGVELRAGYSANAEIVIKEARDVIVIPERLLLFEDEGKTTLVEIPAENPQAEPKKIKVGVGLSDGLKVEILSGLKEGDEIVQRAPREIS